MARVTNIVLNVSSLLLIAVGLVLVGTFFFGSPVQNSAAGERNPVVAGPNNFNVPTLTRKDRAQANQRESDPSNLVAPVPKSKSLWMTIPSMARIDDRLVPYAAGDDEEALRNNAAIHLKGTGFPWEKQANIYIAGHRLGYLNTGSFLSFFDLDNVRIGDVITLKDANGRTYKYRVYRVFTVLPTDTSVTKPVKGKNIVTLQTCTLPDYTHRLIVRAEKVGS